MTQQTELEKFKEKLANNQYLFDMMIQRRVHQQAHLDGLLEIYKVETDELTLWLDATIKKQSKESAN